MNDSKGKVVGIWLNREGLAGLRKALESTPYQREGTYCADAVRERLSREGHLRNDPGAVVVARARELVEKYGAAAVGAKLGELGDIEAEAAFSITEGGRQ